MCKKKKKKVVSAFHKITLEICTLLLLIIAMIIMKEFKGDVTEHRLPTLHKWQGRDSSEQTLGVHVTINIIIMHCANMLLMCCEFLYREYNNK